MQGSTRHPNQPHASSAHPPNPFSPSIFFPRRRAVAYNHLSLDCPHASSTRKTNPQSSKSESSSHQRRNHSLLHAVTGLCTQPTFDALGSSCLAGLGCALRSLRTVSPSDTRIPSSTSPQSHIITPLPPIVDIEGTAHGRKKVRHIALAFSSSTFVHVTWGFERRQRLATRRRGGGSGNRLLDHGQQQIATVNRRDAIVIVCLLRYLLSSLWPRYREFTTPRVLDQSSRCLYHCRQWLSRTTAR